MKKFVKLSIMLFALTVMAQNKVSLSIHQDLKFLTIGDEERGYSPATVDAIFRLKMSGNQNQYGYLVVFPEFEYAEIKGIYKRYSVNVGFTFNKLILKDFEVMPSLGWGWIDRYGKSMFSFGGSTEIAYKINDDIKISIMGQVTERKDLMWLYGNNEIRFSGFIGLEYVF